MDLRDKAGVILELQNSLRLLYLRGYDLPSVIPDGIYGGETEYAVRLYQRLKGLPETGVADILLWQNIRDDIILSNPPQGLA